MNATCTSQPQNAVIEKLKAHRLAFYIVVPVVVALSALYLFFTPNYFKCTVTMITENMMANEHNRVMTLNHPENYDLGFTVPDVTIKCQDFEQIVTSTRFSVDMFDTPVSTLDGSFAGAYSQYLKTQLKPTPKERILGIFHKPAEKASLTAEEVNPFHLVGEQQEIADAVQNNLFFNVDMDTKLVSISATAQDALVAAQVADAGAQLLEHYLGAIYEQKMVEQVENMLQLEAAAEKAYLEAKEAHSPNADMEYQVYQSFRRQRIILDAQKMHHKTFYVLNNATVPVRKAGPKRATMLALILMLSVMGTAACVLRKEIMRWLFME